MTDTHPYSQRFAPSPCLCPLRVLLLTMAHELSPSTGSTHTKAKLGQLASLPREHRAETQRNLRHLWGQPGTGMFGGLRMLEWATYPVNSVGEYETENERGTTFILDDFPTPPYLRL